MFKIDLAWKEFNVCLNMVQTWMVANAGPTFSATQAYSILELWFTEEPTQEVKDAITAYWDGLTAESNECTMYISQEDRAIADAAAKAAAKASATAKLLALGLTTDEINALA
jgi:hypothetical protein